MRAAPPPPAAARRHWLFTGQAGANLLLAGWLFFLLNYLAFHTYRRWDFSLDQAQGLAPKTIEVLRNLNAPVQIHILFKPDHPTYQLVENLLAAYRAESHWIRLEHVDPDRDVARTEQLSRAFALQQPNVVLFESEDRRQIIPAEDLVEYDVAPWQAGQRPERSLFQGEQLFTSALLAITQPRRPVVYFLQGHGEHAVDEAERRRGYSEIVRVVQRDYFEIRPLTLTGPGALPADCDVLVVAGPRTPLAPTVVEQIARFLDRNGRLLALLNHDVDTGLESLLANWGVRVGPEQVIDPTRSPSGREMFVTEYPPHPITRPL
ncbi:MAG: GldG family protein, partial [Candidatus Marinimicrobia bacterium]|nr:GldG family protein [Candidatus Neomarinimicrobiota bacterium]